MQCRVVAALLVLPAIAITHAGGWGEVMAVLRNFNPEFLDPFAFSVGGIIGFLGIGLGSPGNPHILVRYMSISDPRALRKSCVIGTVWNVLMAWGAVFIGLVGRAFYLRPENLPGQDPENLYPLLASVHLHPILVGIVVASIMAAIMSTADSQLLVAASGVVRDIYQKIIARKRSLQQKKLVFLSRVVVLIMVIAALVLAKIASRYVFWLVLFAWGGLGASFGPTILLSLFWKKTTKPGIIAGLISGTAVVIVWNQIPQLKNMIYELVPAFIVSTLLTIIISLMTEPPREAEEELRAISAKYRR
jgi:SSS family transporter